MYICVIKEIRGVEREGGRPIERLMCGAGLVGGQCLLKSVT